MGNLGFKLLSLKRLKDFFYLMVFKKESKVRKELTQISDLLKPELALFDLKTEFHWRKIISAYKGKKINNEELKKTIHCSEIDETGIQY